MIYLITGAARSGTNYVSNLLTNTGKTTVHGESGFFGQSLNVPSLMTAVDQWHRFYSERKHNWINFSYEQSVKRIVQTFIPNGCGEHSTIMNVSEAQDALKIFDKIVYLERPSNQCVESMYKLWKYQFDHGTHSSLRRMTTFNMDKDLNGLSVYKLSVLCAKIEASREVLYQNDLHDRVLRITYNSLLNRPDQGLATAYRFLFGRRLSLGTVKMAVEKSGKEKMIEERPEHFV